MRLVRSGEARAVRAQRFELVDAAGKTRAILGLTADRPVLNLYDAAGKRALRLMLRCFFQDRAGSR